MRTAAIIAAAEKVAAYESPEFQFVTKLKPTEAEPLLALTKLNMETMYNKCEDPEWKWSDSEKLKMFLNSKSRFFITEDGFVLFRFLVENKNPVVYIYELQVRPEAQGRGIGRTLMREVEIFCAKNAPGISACMLTVFRHNENAFEFYKKLGFQMDPISPKTGSYFILSKGINP